MFSYVRSAAAAPRLRVADCAYNAGEIIRQVREAEKKQIKVLVFPELSVTGYTCGDLFFQSSLINAAESAVGYIAAETSDADIFIAIGAPVAVGGALYNCAVAIHKGKILGIVPKSILPNSDEFFEKRIFSPASELNRQTIKYGAPHLDAYAPIGTNLLFQLGDIPGAVAGIEVCQDFWHITPPSSQLAAHGACIILNVSASPEYVGKQKLRRDMISVHAGRIISAYIYASSGPYESACDLLFGGSGIINENGKLLAEREPVTGGDDLVYADIDVELLLNARRRNENYICDGGIAGVCAETVYVPITFSGKPSRRVAKNPFLPEDSAGISAACDEVFSIQTAAVARRVGHVGAKTAVINVSGGLDSTLALLVTVSAFDMLGRPRSEILGLSMPGFGTTGRTKGNALALMNALGVSCRVIDIKAACEQHFKDIGLDPGSRGVAFENAQARERTQIAMDIANMEHGIMIGTGNMSELALGFTTYNGDHMSMFNPNCGVPKTVVRLVVRHLAESGAYGEEASRILSDIADTPISPELLPPDERGEISQETEEKVGPYELIDFFMYYLVRHGFSAKKIAFLAETAFEGVYQPEEIDKWLRNFIRRFFEQQYKRSCSPGGPKIFEISLSARGDFRMPDDAYCNSWLI